MSIAKTLIKTSFLIAIIAVIGSCENLPSKAGANIIQRDTMIEIMTDVQIFESTKQILKGKENGDFEIYKAYKWVFEQYGVTERSFKESIDYYSSDPREFELMYDEVIIRISEKQAEMINS